MKKINLIFIRSKIPSNYSILDEQKRQYLAELNKKYEISKDGETYFFIESGRTEEEFK